MIDEPDSDICVVTHPLGAAGENATRTLLEILSAITTVSLVTADLPGDSAIRDRHEVVELTDRETGGSLPVAAGRFFLNQLRMCRDIARRDEAIILFFGATSYLLPIAFSRAIGRTVILEPRGDVPLTLRLQWEQRVPTPVAAMLAGVVRTLENAGYRIADGVITYTPSMAAELDVDRFEAKLYPHGARYVDVETFHPKIPFEERDRVVGFLGRLDEEKGIRKLAEVAKRLPEDIAFRFIGDGPLRSWLEDELSNEIERGEVELTGWVDHDEVPTELSRLQLLVLFSQPTEGLPTVILESMACGTPVYATSVSGVPDVVRDDETGFLIESNRATAIRDDIVEILGRGDLGQISTTGRELIREEYSFAAAVDRYQKILTQISSPK